MTEPEEEPVERIPDPRSIAIRTDQKAPNGDTIWIRLPSDITLRDGKVIGWYVPDPVALSLFEAKALCEEAVPRRIELLGNQVKTPDGHWRLREPDELMDVMGGLFSAILHSFTALEAFANNLVENLPDDVDLGNKDREKVVRHSGTMEKFKKYVPLHPDCNAIEDTEHWAKLEDLKFLRDGIVHVKSGNLNQAGMSVNDQIVQGDADHCWTEALGIVEAVWPHFFQEHVATALHKRGRSW